jgi:nucleoside-diphosphate-sugar epimerase
MNDEFESFLIFGATGRSGEEIVRQLVKNNKPVRICVRDEEKAKRLFKDISIEKVYTLKEFSDSEINQIITDSSRSVNLLTVVSVIAYNKDSKEIDKDQMYRDQYLVNSLVIKNCQKQKNIKKFVFISSLFMTRPYFAPAKYIQKVRPNALLYKSLLEIQIKHSGLNYLIIRPGKLIEIPGDDSDSYKNVVLGQDDKIGGLVTYKTLSFVFYDLLTKEGKICVDVAGPDQMVKQNLDLNAYRKYRSELIEDITHNKILIRSFEAHKSLGDRYFKGVELIFMGLFLKICSFSFRWKKKFF